MTEPDSILRLTYPSDRRDLEDRVERALFLSGSCGSSIEEQGARTIVRLYFESRELRDEARLMFCENLEGLEVESEEAGSIDWLDYYEHSLEPIEIGRCWIVVPDRRLIPAETSRTPVVIPQERAFGTGSHETTALCMEMLESVVVEGRTTADVGTGSGILAIALEKLGAARVVAFDNDVDTWGVVQENADRNGVERKRIELFYGTIESIAPSMRFDVVVMNIIPEVILPALPEVVRRVSSGGEVIFSGILRERSGMVVERAREAGLGLVDHSERGEWWCGRFRRL